MASLPTSGSLSPRANIIKRPLSSSVVSRTIQLFLLGSDRKAHVVLVGDDVKWEDFIKEIKNRLRIAAVDSVIRITGETIADAASIRDMDKLVVYGREINTATVADLEQGVVSQLQIKTEPPFANAASVNTTRQTTPNPQTQELVTVKPENIFGASINKEDEDKDGAKQQQASCTACRLSKVRCDRKEPCSRCVRLGKVCIYSSRRRGRPPLAIRAAALSRSDSIASEDDGNARRINTILFNAIYKMSNNSCIPRFKLKRFCLYNVRSAVLKQSTYTLDMSLKLMKRAGISLEELLGAEAAAELTDDGINLDTVTKTIVKHQATFAAMRTKPVNQSLNEIYKLAPQAAGASLTRVFHDGQLKYFFNNVAQSIFCASEAEAINVEKMDKDYLTRFIYPLDYKDMFATLVMKYLAQFDAKSGPSIHTFEHVRWVDATGSPFDAHTWVCVECTECGDLLSLFYIVPKFPSAVSAEAASAIAQQQRQQALSLPPQRNLGSQEAGVVPVSSSAEGYPMFPLEALDLSDIPSPGMAQLLGELLSEDMTGGLIDQDLIEALDGIDTVDNDWFSF